MYRQYRTLRQGLGPLYRFWSARGVIQLIEFGPVLSYLLI